MRQWASIRSNACETAYRELFDGAPVAYHELDFESTITRVNRAECELLGYAEREMIGRPIWDFIAGEEHQDSRRFLGSLKFMNPAAEALTGWNQEAARERVVEEVLRLSDLRSSGGAASDLTEILRDGLFQPWTGEAVLPRNGRAGVPLCVVAAPIVTEEETVFGIMFLLRWRDAA